MTRILWLLAYSVFAIGVCWQWALAQENLIEHVSFLVTFDGRDGVEATAQNYREFQRQMTQAQIPFVLERTYTLAISGVSIEAESKYENAISTLAIVDAIQRNQVVTLQANNLNIVKDPNASLPPKPFLAHDYTGLSDALAQTNRRGRGVRIGIIDSGLDYRHPAFGSCYKTEGCRVKYGYDFVGDDFDGVLPPRPDDDPLDTCNSHGTAVAGIIAGDHGEFQGVAPEAELGIYRVTGCKDVLYDRFIIDAVTKALEDDMDIINISMGNNQGFWWSTLNMFAQRLGSRNKMIMAAMGNLGEEYMYTVYSPAISEYTIAVGAYELPYYYGFPLVCHLPSGNFTIMRSTAQLGAPDLSLKPTEVALTTDSANSYTGCAPYNQDLTGKVVLMARGECMGEVKATNAENAGAVAVVVINTVYSTLAPFIFEDPNHIPVVLVSLSDGQTLIDQAKKATIMVSATAEPAIFKHPNPYTVAPYSSWGPGLALENKPDLLGPGSNLYVPVSLNHGSYGIVSGTSFATAYMTGCAALVAETGSLSYLNLMNKLGDSAQLQMGSNGLAVPVIEQGIGMVNLTRLLSGSAQKFNQRLPLFLGTEMLRAGAVGPTATLSNIAANRLRHVPSISVTPYDAQGTLLRQPRVSDVTAKLTFTYVKSTGRTQISVDIQHFNQTEMWVYSGYVELLDRPKGRVIDRLSYVGLAADRKQIPLLPPANSPSAPCLTRGRDQTCLAIATGSVPNYTMTGEDMPSIRYRLQYGSVALFFTVITTVNGQTTECLINNGDPRAVVRNDFKTMHYTALWDGYYFPTYSDRTAHRAPAGTYQLRLRVCKHMYTCYPTHPDHIFHIWKSAPFTITR
ncbi:hypothetical protein H4R35_003008 [Dimargaris xerosporica]|nr:hypothetical protein H4R35_003008 [Dimargaris xerosporica]